MTHKLSERTKKLISLIDDYEIQERIYALFEIDPVYVGSPASEKEVERARFSVIKCAMKSELSFDRARHFYHADVRDLYLNSGFGQAEAHDRWASETLSKSE